MFFALLLTLIQPKTKICICDRECYSSSSYHCFLSAPKSNFQKFIFPYLNKDKEIELLFYSKNNGFHFELDLSYFDQKKVILKNLLVSKTINISLINKKSIINNIQIHPNQQMILPTINISFLKNYQVDSFNSDLINLNKHFFSSDDVFKNINTQKKKLNQVDHKLAAESIVISGETITIETSGMTQSSSGWTQSGDNLYSEEEGSTITVEVPCSQFWVSGTVDPNYGNIDIIVDDEYESTVSLYQETHEANINIYESPKYLSNKKRKIIIKNEGNRPVSIYRIYYNAFPYFDKPVNNVDGLINITCDQFTYEGGWVKCHDNERWADIGSYTNDAGGKVSYKFTGSRVHAFSLRQNRDGEKRCNAKFFIDNKEICEINLFPTTTHHQVVFSSDYLPFGEHTIEIAHGEVSGGPIIFCSFYVDPLPKIGGEKLGYNDIKGNDKSDNWEYKNEENKTPYFTTTNINAFVIFKFHGTRFWLTGIRDSTYGKFDLIIDEESHIEIDETKGISNFAYPERAYNNAILLYESDVLQLKDHTVKIVNKDNKRITIINLLYSTQPHNAILIPAEEIKFDENWNKEDDGGYSTMKDNSIAEINKYFNQFWIIGNKTPKQGKMNIYYNDEYQLDINPPEIETIFDKEILFYELKNIKHNSYDLKIKKTSTSGDINTEESLHINYCYYLNEKSFTIPSETITIETSGMTQSSSGWTQSGDNLYSEVEGSTITVEVPCSQFWVSGTVDPNYGNIDIIVDDEYESTVSLYQETHEANINFYESPKYLSNKKRKIILKNEGNRPVSIYRIYYNAFPYFDKPVNNVDGLINITCDQFTYEGGWVKCHDNERWADIGSYTNDAGGKISYKFTGSRVHAFSLRQNRDGEKRCNAKFFIDNKEICEINLFPTTTHHQVVFSSDYLPFGEHTIEIAHGEVSGGPIIFCSFYVDPLPKIGGEKLGYNDIKGNDKSDNWEYKNEENKTPYFTTTNINAFVIFKFHGTRFWLTGIRDSTYGKFDLIIDEESHIEIDETKGISNFAYPERAYNNAILLYESDVLQLKDHTVKIVNKDNKRITIINLLYSTQPHNAILIPAEEIKFDENWNKEDDGGYSTTKDNSIAEINKYFNQFWIIGNKTPKQGKMNIYYNDEYQLDINPPEIETIFDKEILFYELKNIKHNSYDLKIKKTSTSGDINTEESLHINYCYYLNEKSFTIPSETITIETSGMTQSSSGWTQSGDNLYSEVEGSTITVEVPCSQFWVSGTVDPNYGNIDIIVDDEYESTVSLYQETHEANINFYESPKYLSNKKRKIILKNEGNRPVSIYRIYYNAFPYFDKPVNNVDGLINITCDQFTYEGGWVKCHDNERWADIGSYTNDAGGKISYKFTGSRVHAFSLRQNRDGEKRCNAKFFIDNKEICEINLFPTTTHHQVVFSSDYLPFGEHTIEIAHGEVSGGPIIFCSFYVDPLPKIGGEKLGYNDIKGNDKSDNWEYKNEENKTPYFTTTNINAFVIFKFHGTRFWLTGIRDSTYGKFDLIIDEESHIEIDETKGISNFAYPERAYNNAILLYESDVLQLKDHTVKIVNKDNKRITIINLLYSTQPHNAILIPAEEIKFDENWNKEDDGGYSTMKDNSIAEINKYFNQFWIIGNKTPKQGKMNIYYNDEYQLDINPPEIETIFDKEILFYELKNIKHNSYDLKIKKTSTSGDINTEESLHINYCYYLNEKSFTIPSETITIETSGMTQSSSGWTQSGDNLYSEVEGSTITVEVPCSQFWVSGTVDPNYGNIDIIVDDEYESTVSLYQETHEANINFYESPKYLSNKKRKIILKNEGNRPVSIYRIYYNAFPYFDKPVNNVDGLINITCDQFTYEGGWVKCHDNERWADIGSYTNDAGGKISYKFTGSRVHAFSLRQNRDGEKRCNAKFFIDNKEICEINLFPTTTHHQVVFSSDYLPFGEHTIEIAHGEVSGGPIIFCSFYVDPLPKIGGEKLGYNDIKGNDKSDNWEYKNEENKTPYFTTTNINAFVIFKFHGTRFWLTGIRDSTYGKFDLIIDEESHIEIDETKGISNFAYPERAYNNAILLYESDVLQLKDHTVKIVNKDNKRITIINLLYSTQPHNAILIPAEEIKFDENWNKEDDGGYSTTKDNSIAEINKYFNQFWIIGNKTPKQGKMNIYYNDEYQLDINPPEIETIFDKEILFYELKNIKHNSYDLKIKKTSTSGDINTEESLHINYCYYLNEKSFTIPSETITIETSGMTQSSSGWTQSGDNLYSEVEGSTITVEVPCSQFWVSGTVDPNYGNIDIIVDDEYESTVSLYQETHEANINFYESPKYLSNKKRKIILKNEGNRPVSIYRIYYNAFPYFDKPVNNVDGLINITCDQFTYEGGWVKCHDNERWADIGSYTNDAGGKISYKFTGSRVHAFSLRQNRDGEKRCNAKFFIDNKEICEINLFPTTTHHQVVFSSDYLPFGEHTIEIAHGEVSGGPIIFCSFYVDPLPKIGGEKLGYNDIKGNDKSDNWEYKNEENKTPYFTTTNINAFVIFKFHGTRFWLTGIRDSTYGKFDLIIDEESHIEIDETKGISNFAYPERAYNNAILLYESDVLQLKDHTVKIVNKDNKRITIINLLYSTQPHNAILIPAEEIKFDENWNKEDDGGYSTTKDNSIAEINKYFNQFWIIGNKTPKQGKMNIYYNDEYQLDINPPEIETIFDKEILFYELKNIKHNSYDLKIMKTSTDSNINTEESLHINYCYYLNEKSFTIPSETIVIEVNGMIDQASGAWTIINNDLYSDQEGSAIIVNLFSHKFWITGALDPNYGTVDISIDDKIKSSVSLYHENHEENIVFYESPDELTYKEHFIKLTNKDNNPIKIGQINYKYIPPTFIFSQSQYFTDSFFFSESKDFSGTYAFSKSEDFSRTHAFSKSNIFSKSNDFSKSGIFTETIAFSKSDVFSKSSFFTKSSDFSNSAIFSKTNYFTKTNKFSGTTDFTNTNCFTRSNDFTKSNNFMDSNLFTNSQYFSATTKFTKSDLLTESNHFTKSNSFVSSDIFTKSNDFSKSNSFSTSNYFSKTNHFSGTSYFSTTDDFTKSTSFTDSNLFSSSRSFSKSSDFSSTKHFSHTNLFSNTEHFTVTNHFTKTNDFTNSCFMQSASFSGTNKFSRSQKFTNTNDFSNSNYFSRSNEFSQSEPLPPIDDIGETCVVESSAKNYTLNRKCEFTSVNDINYLIHITRSNFTDFIEERNGGAIYIINGGVNCSNISFINCSSSSGCGGGVYIKNRLDLNYNISFRYSFFTLCKAFYGGAAYIYSYSEMNQIEIYACYFLKNYALGQKAKEKNLFGGAHVFITSRLLNITISKFERGIGEGGALKIYNKFDDDDEKSLRKLDEIHDSIWISGCKFDLAKGSKSSLSFEDDKELSTINVFDCDFTGKLSKGSHYIDGKISIKDDSKQIISSNKFEYENDDAVNLETVEKDQSVAPKYSHSNSKHLLMIVSCVSILAIVFIAFIIKTTNPEYDFNDESN